MSDLDRGPTRADRLFDALAPQAMLHASTVRAYCDAAAEDGDTFVAMFRAHHGDSLPIIDGSMAHRAVSGWKLRLDDLARKVN